MRRTRRRLAAAVALLFLLAVPSAGAWTWPVIGPVLQPFAFDPAHPYGGGQHRGVDIGGDAGATVVAPAGGTVTFAGTVPSNGASLTILTPDGLSVTLTHLGSLAVARGAAIAEGAAVGTVGPSGTPELTVPYVHLGVRRADDDNAYLDPLGLLPSLAPAAPRAPAPAPPPPVATPATPAPQPAPSAAATAPAPAVPEPAAPAPAAAPVAAPPAEPVATPMFDPAPPGTVVERAASRTHAGPTPTPSPAPARATVRPVVPTAAVREVPRSSARQGPPAARHAPPVVPRRVRSLPVAASMPVHRAPFPFALAAAAATALGVVLTLVRMLFLSSATHEGARTVGEDPGCAGVAVCERPAAHRPRGGLRRAGGRLRPLSPAEGRRRPDGQRHRRARDAGDGVRRSRRRVAA